MAYGVVNVVLLLALLLAGASVHGADGGTVTGSISCPQCTNQDELAGIGVAIKCGQVTQATVTLTDNTGSFKVHLPSSPLLETAPCYAMLVSGPRRQCKFKEGHISSLVNDRLTSPLTLSPSSCVTKPGQALMGSWKLTASGEGAELGDSKTIDLPLPPEWGLPPTSYYTYPFIPIIGIP